MDNNTVKVSEELHTADISYLLTMLFVYILQPSNYTIFHFPSPLMVTKENITVCNIHHLGLMWVTMDHVIPFHLKLHCATDRERTHTQGKKKKMILLIHL